MINSHGKAFEDKIRRVAKSLDWYILRLPTPSGYYTMRQPGDFIFFTPTTTLIVECKATKDKKYNAKGMRQLDKFQEFRNHTTQGSAVLIVDFVDEYSMHVYSYAFPEGIEDRVLTLDSSIKDLKELLLKVEKESANKVFKK